MYSRYSINIDGEPIAIACLSLRTLEVVSLDVRQEFRRQGYGRRLMKMICDQADREGVALDIMAAGSEEAMSTKQLEAWYARFGFVPRPRSCIMVRHPRTGRK